MMATKRTIWAEHFVESFAGTPLTAESVFYSPQYIDKRTQKEVCDFLIILRGKAILVSMKSQEDPSTRTGDKLERWIIKNAKEALGQAKGALKTINREHFWCQHSRRGRVDFTPGAVSITHVAVLTEIFGKVVELSEDFPSSIGDVPVTYLSVNDFCNLINEFRAFPDITAYLQARRTLSDKSLRIIGDEVPFYKYYILNEKSFTGCFGYEDARITAAARDSDWQVFLTYKPVTAKFASIVEYVSDALATRLENYSENLDNEIVALFDPSDSRRHYLLMQEELCDLRLSERHALGMQFTNLMEKVKRDSNTESMAYSACHTEAKNDFVYVLIASRGIDRSKLIKRANILLRAAISNYKKKRGMVITDRDGKNFEIQIIAQFSPTLDDKKLGEKLFSHLKMSAIQVS